MTSALEYFSAKLSLETDASDVYAAQKAGEQFVLVDVRSDDAWRQGRISGAVHLPRPQIAEQTVTVFDRSVPVVVYCWSPGCNAGTKAALEFAKLGFDVKEMIGGYEYWVRGGQPTQNDEGALPRVFDAQVMVVRTPVAG